MMQWTRQRPPLSPGHHVGGVVLSGRHAQLDDPHLRVWVTAPDVMPWPRRGPLWRNTIVREAAPARRSLWAAFRAWLDQELMLS